MVCAFTSLAYPKQPCVAHIIWCYSSRIFYVFLYNLVTITVTVSSDVTDVLQCDHDITLTLILNLSKENKSKKGKKKELDKETSIQALYI